jgi:transcriptional regulator with XRE-family HTH domain
MMTSGPNYQRGPVYQMPRLRQIREARFLSQADLSRLAHVSVTTIRRIEAGATPASPSTARKLISALEVGPSVLIDGYTNPFPELAG